ncbi:MAG: circularly permuted type 2 ATP-grasp protein, partial [Elusimicrobia bacterium]|nr:circularly permuted type 2 ATP-grasp protein [Elusimicrobiota bacterium]
LIVHSEWRTVEAGLKQRLKALNRFIDDVYNERRIVRDGAFPEELLAGSKHLLPACRGVRPPGGVWAHVSGSDLVRGADGRLRVLEDNLRIPSGVSYVLENRSVMKRAFPEVFAALDIAPVDDYPSMLHATLASLSPRRSRRPRVAVLTPGIYNSAYFEHSFLAQQMGAELVEGRDLFVGSGDVLYMRTISGPERVDVLYRRVDDAFLDPEVFREDSMLGVPGLMRAWKAGRVVLANAPGTGVADDKAVYAYVPRMIRYYLREDPILPSVPTYLCSDPRQRAEVLARLPELVVKPVNESGGYGIVIGPRATRAQLRAVRGLILADPRNYVAQPLVALSTAPTVGPGGVAARHLDLRTFTLMGRSLWTAHGGLTRVALRKGSFVVNSSQGGGSKDTWVVADPAESR